MNQRKIAISLAVIGAIAAPFAFRTYEMDPVLWRVVPYTTEEKEKDAAFVADHCEGITEDMPQPPVTPTNVDEWARWQFCIGPVQDLKRGGEAHAYSSTLMYLVVNAVAAAASFVIIYGLTFLLSALARRYWRWLNT